MDPSSSAWALKQGYLFVIACTLTAGSVAAAVIYQLYCLLRPKQRVAVLGSSSWPPSPPALPILGHLHLIKAKPHLDLYELSLKYGPLFVLRMGSTNVLVVSSAKMAKEVLKIHDKSFASRCSTGASPEIFSHNYQDLACAPYGPHWRHLRKLCLLELFTTKRIESFANLRDEETSALVRNVFEESRDGRPVTLTGKLTHTILNMMSLMTMGKRLIPWGSDRAEDETELRNFRETVKEVFMLSGVLNNIGDYFPRLRRWDLQGYERRMRKASQSFDDFILKMIKLKRSHVQEEGVESQKDLLDVLLSLPNEKNGKLSDDIVTATMMNILSAGVDTSATTIEWAIAELIRHPKKLREVQDEIDARVGRARTVEEADVPHLKYLDAVVKEILRLHPPAPLLIPHESIEPCRLQGYDIPAKTRLYVNVWAIGHDPKSWDRPYEFYPERFFENDIDVRGQHFELLPFGSGRRMCPGMSLGLIVIQFTLARLLHSFDFSLPPGQSVEDMDMSDSFGLTVSKTEPLELVAKARLPRALY